MNILKLFLPLLAISFASCGTPEAKSPSDDSGAMPVADNEPSLKVKQDNARFIVETFDDTSLLVPHSKISVEYGDSRTFLDDIAGIAEIQQGGNEEMEIPADAIASCGCWYAGGGDYFYIARSATGIKVFHGWLDEMQEDSGYHWEEIKSIE